MTDQHDCKWGHDFGMSMASAISKLEKGQENIIDLLTDERVTMREHIDEASRPGGWHDRISMIEREISIIKQGYWKASLVAGAIGGLLGSGSPEAIRIIAKFLIGH